LDDPDRVDLVGHMHQQSPARPYSLTSPPGEILQNNSVSHLNGMVHYVVPGKDKNIKRTPSDTEKEIASIKKEKEDTENEKNDLKVYVSTPNGLKRVVERTNSQASSNTSSAPALPQKNASSSAKPKNKKVTKAEEDQPPPPLPRKPQMHDPLGVLNSELVSSAQSPLKYQSLDTREFHSNGYSANNSSSGDSSPPSSLSAESTNSENTKSANINKVHLGAIP
jgi:hypothetical protein